jgi:uncharacterized protein YbjT (DUF2867 family)
MTNPSQTTLVLGGTGRTGSLVAKNLRNRGLAAQTAARHGADVLFDWDDPATQSAALTGADRIYLVAPCRGSVTPGRCRPSWTSPRAPGCDTSPI